MSAENAYSQVLQPANKSEQLVLSALFQSKLQKWVDFAGGYKGDSKILTFHISFKSGLELVSWCAYWRKCAVWSLCRREQTIGNTALQWDTEMMCSAHVIRVRKLRGMYHGLLWEWPKQSGVGKVCARARIASEHSWFLVWITLSQIQSPAQ